MVGKITGVQRAVPEHLAQADRAAEAVRHTWVTVDGSVKGQALWTLDEAGLCRPAPPARLGRDGPHYS